MKYQKRWGFGFGTILSLIIVYFIYLYSKEHGWVLLTFVSKWYLIISLAIIGLFVSILVLSLLVVFIAFILAYFKVRKLKKNRKKKDYIDVDYVIKDE